MNPYPVQPSRLGALDRRRFLEGMGLGAAAVFLPGWRGMAEEVKLECPYALNPVRPVLGAYTPPAAKGAMEQVSKLEFYLMGWGSRGGKKAASLKDFVFGSLTVERQREGERTVYRSRRESEDDVCEGEVICRAGEIETVESWSAKWHRPGAEISVFPELEVSGAVKAGKVLVREGEDERATPLTAPLIAESSLFFQPGLIDRLTALAGGFARLDQTLIPRVEQRARTAGSITPQLRQTDLQAWLLTGRGTVPLHFVRDAARLPLFFTGFLSSSALKAIS